MSSNDRIGSSDFIKWSLRQFCHLTNVARFNNVVGENFWTISGNFTVSTEFNGNT